MLVAQGYKGSSCTPTQAVPEMPWQEDLNQDVVGSKSGCWQRKYFLKYTCRYSHLGIKFVPCFRVRHYWIILLQLFTEYLFKHIILFKKIIRTLSSLGSLSFWQQSEEEVFWESFLFSGWSACVSFIERWRWEIERRERNRDSVSVSAFHKEKESQIEKKS